MKAQTFISGVSCTALLSSLSASCTALFSSLASAGYFEGPDPSKWKTSAEEVCAALVRQGPTGLFLFGPIFSNFDSARISALSLGGPKVLILMHNAVSDLAFPRVTKVDSVKSADLLASEWGPYEQQVLFSSRGVAAMVHRVAPIPVTTALNVFDSLVRHCKEAGSVADLVASVNSERRHSDSMHQYKRLPLDDSQPAGTAKDEGEMYCGYFQQTLIAFGTQMINLSD